MGFRAIGHWVRITSLLIAVSLAAAAWAEESGNLLQAPQGQCTKDSDAANTIPGWNRVDGSPTLLCPTMGGIATPASAPLEPGLIGSGPYGDSTLERVVDVAGASAAIDGAAISYRLSAWLGGAGTAAAALTAEFRDGAGNPMGAATSLRNPDQTARSRTPRGKRAVLVAEEATGPLLPGTRSILLRLRFTRTAGGQSPGFADHLSLTVTAKLDPPPVPPPLARIPAFDHVFLIVMENTDYGQVIGDTSNAPYINALAARGALLAHYDAVYHPSDENYLAIAAGDTFVRGGAYFPKIHLAVPHLGDRIEMAHKSWKAYEQGMGTPCNVSTKFDRYYEPDDAPFVNFADIIDDSARCRTHLVDTKELPGDLQSSATTPSFAWIAADDYDDGEDSGNGSPKSLRVQDAWLRRTLEPIFASPAWTGERSLIILTWDESNATTNNHIATILLGSMGLVRSGWVSPVPYDHYSTARTIEEALRLGSLTANDAYGRPINDAFNDVQTAVSK